MIDTKTVVQEVQKELLAAVQRGQDQVRKGQERVQERVRQRQEQVRKHREAVAGAVTELAKSVRPGGSATPTVHIPSPAEVRTHAQQLANHAITVRDDLANRARHAAGPYAERVKTAQRDLTEIARGTVPYAERIVAMRRDLAERARRAGIADQVAAAQRTLADRFAEAAKVATPFVAEGRARLSHVVRSANGHVAPTADTVAPTTEVITPEGTPAAAPAAPEATSAAPKATPVTPAATPKARAATPKAKTAPKAKANTASTGRTAGASKPRTPKK
jgi:hypothetical protein